jgi:hypothetical protein
MSAAQSNAEAVLVAIPMVFMLFVVLFRLDELISKPAKQPGYGRKLCNWDADGAPICPDPTQTVYTIRRRNRSMF